MLLQALISGMAAAKRRDAAQIIRANRARVLRSVDDIYRALNEEGDTDPAEIYEAFAALPNTDRIMALEMELAKAKPEQVEQLHQLLKPIMQRAWIPLPGPQTLAYNSKALFIGYGGQAGGGKALRADEPVLTPSGWVEIRRLRVGSKVCAVDGTVTEVIGVYPQGVRPLRRVHFHDGTSVVCDEDHIWRGWWTGRFHKIGGRRASAGEAAGNYTTAEIMSRIEGAATRRASRFAVPAMECPAAFNVPGCPRGLGYLRRDVDPYLLGLILGDGCLSGKIEITSGDAEITEWLVAHLGSDVVVDASKPCRAHRIIGGTAAFLREQFQSDRLGLAGTRAETKFIPRVYLFGSVEKRWALLQGLMDTDGWADPDGDTYFCTVSPRLAGDVSHLARSLGALVFTREKAPIYTHDGEKREGQLAYTLRIKVPEPERLFRLERKKALCRGKQPQSMAKYVDWVEPVGAGEAVCIRVRHPSGLFLTRDFTVTHNSDVILGLTQEHRRSLILRREAVQLTALTDRMQEIYGAHGSYVSNPVRRFNFRDGRTVIFGHCNEPNDWRGYAGQARDFLALDEATEFLHQQFIGLKAWVRSADESQRTRVLLATNPPRGEEGYWFVDMFAPWIDEGYKNRALPGEIRWGITPAGQIEFLEDPARFADGRPKPVIRNGEEFTPQSYTFIPAKLGDNPYLVRSGYREQLQGLEDHTLRKQLLYGDFAAARQDDAYQVIPSAWVDAAMERWTPDPPPGANMVSIGVDVAGGGDDPMVMAPCWGLWFGNLTEVKDEGLKNGRFVAAQILMEMRDSALVVIDVGGGWAGGAIVHLEDEVGVDLLKFNASAVSYGRAPGGKTFLNLRAEAWWELRRALDPAFGVRIALPPDKELKRELCAPRYSDGTLDAGRASRVGYRIEGKDALRKRLGRSTNRADAVIMAYWGSRERTSAAAGRRASGQQAFAVTNYAAMKRPMLNSAGLQSFARPGKRRW